IFDLRLAVRMLRRTPGVTAVVLLTLALGIGANAAIFGVVRGVLLKPLSYPDPDGVITIWSTNRARGSTRDGVSRQDADDWRASAHSLAALGTYVSIEGNAVVGGEAQRIRVALASADVFRVLRV